MLVYKSSCSIFYSLHTCNIIMHVYTTVQLFFNYSCTIKICLYMNVHAATPQRPSRPVVIKTQSNSITVGWDQPLCDGGHTVIEFDLQYYDSSKSFFDRVTVNVPHIEPSVRNYTATGLEPSTPYQFRVRVLSSDLRNSAFSIVRQITTLPAGR